MKTPYISTVVDSAIDSTNPTAPFYIEALVRSRVDLNLLTLDDFLLRNDDIEIIELELRGDIHVNPFREQVRAVLQTYPANVHILSAIARARMDDNISLRAALATRELCSLFRSKRAAIPPDAQTDVILGTACTDVVLEYLFLLGYDDDVMPTLFSYIQASPNCIDHLFISSLMVASVCELPIYDPAEEGATDDDDDSIRVALRDLLQEKYRNDAEMHRLLLVAEIAHKYTRHSGPTPELEPLIAQLNAHPLSHKMNTEIHRLLEMDPILKSLFVPYLLKSAKLTS